jgi:hypothetical protein
MIMTDAQVFAEYLASTGYGTVEEWATDQGYYFSPVSCEWYESLLPFAETVDIEREFYQEACNMIGLELR